MQLHCTIQNKHWIISIDLTINSCREFEFTIKTMNALLSERFIHHQRVASTCYSQLQQLKDCTIFPIINYFLVKYPIFTFFSVHVHITTCHRIVYTSCAQRQLKWWMMMMIDDDDEDGYADESWWWMMMMGDDEDGGWWCLIMMDYDDDNYDWWWWIIMVIGGEWWWWWMIMEDDYDDDGY